MNKTKLFIALSCASLLAISCKTASTSPTIEATKLTPSTPTWALVNQDTIAKNLKVLASVEFEGRRTGEKGQKLAAQYLVDHYKNIGLSFPEAADNYFQVVPSEYMKKPNMVLKDSENVWAFLKGSEFPDEVLIVSAHYDHMGYMEGELYPGADDNGSGTAAVMEIARVFQDLAKQGVKPKRSILFLHVTGEEFGLFGSRYYAENPILPLENAIANINIDMIGRRSDQYPTNDDYVYVVGADKISQDLHDMVVQANKASTNIDLDFTFNDEDHPEKIYYRSDHYSFAKHGIPAVFFYNGAHPDYHQPTDTFENIDMPILTKRAQLIFASAWKLANADERPRINQK